VENRIAGEHGSLRKSTDDGLLVVNLDLPWEFFEERQYSFSRQGQALWNLYRQIANATGSTIFLDAPEVDDPPGTRVAQSHIERKRRFGKEPSYPSWSLDHVSERHQIVTRRSESMEEHDKGTITAPMAVDATN
jgi:hypothetical protein